MGGCCCCRTSTRAHLTAEPRQRQLHRPPCRSHAQQPRTWAAGGMPQAPEPAHAAIVRLCTACHGTERARMKLFPIRPRSAQQADRVLDMRLLSIGWCLQVCRLCRQRTGTRAAHLPRQLPKHAARSAHRAWSACCILTESCCSGANTQHSLPGGT